ncbi:MAG: flagellar motor switch protein FliN [Tepidisphaeraceae bacterium]|jgi:flagellar motor switch protein FliN/FliY
MADDSPSDPNASPPPPNAAIDLDSGGVDQAAIDDLLKQASFEDVAAADASPGRSAAPAGDLAGQVPGGAAADALPAGQEFSLPNLQQVMADAAVSGIDLLRDVDLNVKIELGRARMMVEEVLKLGEGSVVELDKLAGDPVDILVNDRLVAHGEVLVLNDNFCVRINEIVAGLQEEGQ